MANAVFVVYADCIGGGLNVYALCMNRKAAVMARSQVAQAKEKLSGHRCRYYNLPLSNPYRSEIRIVSVVVDVVYRNGLDERKLGEFSGNSNEKEVIR